MPVNLSAPDPKDLHPVAGVSLGIAEAAIRKPGRKDLLVIALAPGARVAGVFTSNRFAAAPVQVCREHLARAVPRALVVNTGCANAGTGSQGLADARASCEALAGLLGISAQEVLPFSTGVIMEPLPIDRLRAGLPAAVAGLGANRWADAATAIMTTDTVAKAASAQMVIDGRTVTVTGIAKGAGMIRPDMATMLGYVATDAAVGAALLPDLTRRVADRSFNRITVDGDTSTNDSFIVIATGAAGMAPVESRDDPRYAALEDALAGVAGRLAQAIVRDGEGATKFITIEVEQGGSMEECTRVAYAIAHSPLVKTAFFASDPNLGRILAAIGNAGVAGLDVDRVRLFLDDVLVAEKGGRAASYTEADGQRIMAKPEILIRVQLDRGAVGTTVWTCDFSYDYVRINADYRS